MFPAIAEESLTSRARGRCWAGLPWCHVPGWHVHRLRWLTPASSCRPCPAVTKKWIHGIIAEFWLVLSLYSCMDDKTTINSAEVIRLYKKNVTAWWCHVSLWAAWFDCGRSVFWSFRYGWLLPWLTLSMRAIAAVAPHLEPPSPRSPNAPKKPDLGCKTLASALRNASVKCSFILPGLAHSFSSKVANFAASHSETANPPVHPQKLVMFSLPSEMCELRELAYSLLKSCHSMRIRYTTLTLAIGWTPTSTAKVDSMFFKSWGVCRCLEKWFCLYLDYSSRGSMDA